MTQSYHHAVAWLLSVLMSTCVCLGEDSVQFHPGRVIPMLEAGQQNLVPNANFECGTDGWGSTELDVLPGWYGTLNGLFGKLDSTTAADGAASLKIELTPENMPVAYNDYLHTQRQWIKAPLAANVGWLAVKPGQNYTFSVAMKAAETGTPARLVVRQFRAAPFSKLVRLTTAWQRYSLEFTPTAEACYVLAGPDLGKNEENSNPPARATMWLDAVQLAPTEVKAPFAPRQPIEFGVATGKPGNIFSWEEPLDFRLTVASAEAKEQRKADIELRLTDFFDQEVWRDTRSLIVPAQSSRELAVTVGPSPELRGYLRLHATMTSGTTKEERSLRLASIPVYSLADSRFGMNHAFGWPEMLRLCKQAGVLWMRDWSMKWQDVEPEQGRFAFDESDAQIDRILRQDLKVLGVLAFPSAMWSSSAPENVPRNDPWYLTYSNSPDPETQRDEILAESGSQIRCLGYAPRDMKEFQDYVAKTVAHYKGRVHDWQVFNEPIYTGYALPWRAGYTSDDYVRYVEAFVEAARQSDPQCRVFGGYCFGAVTEPLRFISLGGLKHIDVFTLHWYQRKNPPEVIEGLLQPVVKAMAEQGVQRPIWFTEYACYADDDPWIEPIGAVPAVQRGDAYRQASERVQAEHQVRFAATLFANGVDKLFFHAGTGSAINHGNLWAMFLRYGSEPLKCYASQAVMAQFFTPDSKFVRRLLPDEPIRAYLFRNDKDLVAVIWAPGTEKPREIRLADAKLQLRDLMGRPQTSRAFTPSGTPVYVVGDGVSPEDFENALLLGPAHR